MARVYISSTFGDLKEHREAAYHALRELRHDVIAMEDYVASEERPVDRCLADVAACDVYVGIFAWRYGYIPSEQKLTRRSITELEYRKAVEVGKPRLIFLLDKDAAWPVQRLDAITGDGDRGQRIAQLRAELGTERLVSFFTTQDELARLVSVAVQQQIGRTLIEFARFSEHMRRFAGATEENAEKRYTPLRLQMVHRQPLEAGGVRDETLVGTLQELVSYPAYLLLVGEPGSGKTTTLLYEVQRLARKAQASSDVSALPIYLRLASFIGKDASDLLGWAAQSASISPASLLDLWERKLQPIYLFLDGAEEVRDVERLVAAIRSLVENQATVFHSLVIGCRAGAPFLEKAANDLPMVTALMLPLRDRQIDEFLDHYEATALKQELSSRLRETLNKPDLLSALAQAAPEMPAEELPRSAGGIYRLLIERLLQRGTSEYDYDRVKKPVLAGLAYQLIAGKQQAFIRDDALYDRIAEHLDAIHSHYRHRRRLMPYDWTAEGLLDEMLASAVLEEVPDQPAALAFSQRLYRDFFAAIYLQLNAANAGALSATIAQDLYSWAEPLAILLGLAPTTAVSILDEPTLAVQPMAGQLWLENHPEGVAPPACMVQRSDELAAAFGAGPAMRHRSAGDARHRLVLVQAASAPGRFDGDFLLRLAGDEHPLVRGAAQYALLHAGETLEPGVDDILSPPMLLVSPSNEFIFRSWGGGDARIGPLDLLHVPVPADVMIKAQVGAVDFDLFTVPSEFCFLHVPPGHLVARMFDRATAPGRTTGNACG